MASITRTVLFASEDVDSASADTLFTVPTSPSSLILINGRLRFVNHTGGAVTVKAWAVPLSGSALNSNLFLPTTSIGANSYLDVDIPQMGPGAFVQAQAGAATSITAIPLDGAYYAQ